MNADAKQFFSDQKIPIEKIILVGTTRRNLSAASIEAAAESLYVDIMAGAQYRQIRLAWEVYSRAKRLKMKDDQADRDELKAIKKRLKRLELPWWKRAFGRAD